MIGIAKPMSVGIYGPIKEFCEEKLSAHGDSPQGMGWNDTDASVRYKVMLELIRAKDRPCSLLDFGCGTARLLDFIIETNAEEIVYSGLDVSEKAVAICREKYPDHTFYSQDLTKPEPAQLPVFDYVIMNGILTYKGRLSQSEMFSYAKKLLPLVFSHSRKGLAFNVMSKNVDWERNDLFHLSIDLLMEFLTRNMSRHIVIRQDYGLYEYSVFVYKEVCEGGLEGAKRLVTTG